MIKNLEELEKDIPSDVFQKVKELIDMKKNGHGKDNVKEIPVLDKQFKETFDRYHDLVIEKKNKGGKAYGRNFLKSITPRINYQKCKMNLI